LQLFDPLLGRFEEVFIAGICGTALRRSGLVVALGDPVELLVFQIGALARRKLFAQLGVNLI